MRTPLTALKRAYLFRALIHPFQSTGERQSLARKLPKKKTQVLVLLRRIQKKIVTMQGTLMLELIWQAVGFPLEKLSVFHDTLGDFVLEELKSREALMALMGFFKKHHSSEQLRFLPNIFSFLQRNPELFFITLQTLQLDRAHPRRHWHELQAVWRGIPSSHKTLKVWHVLSQLTGAQASKISSEPSTLYQSTSSLHMKLVLHCVQHDSTQTCENLSSSVQTFLNTLLIEERTALEYILDKGVLSSHFESLLPHYLRTLSLLPERVRTRSNAEILFSLKNQNTCTILHQATEILSPLFPYLRSNKENALLKNILTLLIQESIGRKIEERLYSLRMRQELLLSHLGNAEFLFPSTEALAHSLCHFNAVYRLFENPTASSSLNEKLLNRILLTLSTQRADELTQKTDLLKTVSIMNLDDTAQLEALLLVSQLKNILSIGYLINFSRIQKGQGYPFSIQELAPYCLRDVSSDEEANALLTKIDNPLQYAKCRLWALEHPHLKKISSAQPRNTPTPR